jgi:hypothetical protein
VIFPAGILRITGLDNRLPIFTGTDWAGTGRYQEHFAGKWLNLLPSRGQRAAGRARRAVAALSCGPHPGLAGLSSTAHGHRRIGPSRQP